MVGEDGWKMNVPIRDPRDESYRKEGKPAAGDSNPGWDFPAFIEHGCEMVAGKLRIVFRNSVLDF